MIVIDTNIIAALCIPSPQTKAAEALLATDQNWHAPILWISEFRNVVSKHIRRGSTSFPQAEVALHNARKTLPESHTHFPEDQRILELLSRSGCTSYDCEFVAVAESLDVPLVTWDGQVLKNFPERAVTPEAFVTHHRRKH